MGQSRAGTDLSEGDAAGTYKCMEDHKFSKAVVILSELHKVKLVQPPRSITATAIKIPLSSAACSAQFGKLSLNGKRT